MGTTDSTSKTIQSKDDFKENPRGYADRWQAEMAAADKETEAWEKDAGKIVDRFLDRRGDLRKRDETRLNLFTANVQTVRAMLYGQVPSVEVKRRYDDANDDPARVAGNILERLLNNDIQRDDDPYTDVLRYALDDRLIVGLGTGRVRYDAEFQEQTQEAIVSEDGVTMAEAVTQEIKVWEDAIIDYVAWRDVRWSPARTWGEVRWVAFRAYLTRDQVTARFGEKHARLVPYSQSKRFNSASEQLSDAMQFDAWARAEVWEIWCKEDGRVYWWVKGYERTLDVKDDPLELEGFFPCPKFFLANPTTSSLMPRPDFMLHRDLYNEIDYVSTRIERLERAVKAVGCYDQAATGVQRMLDEGFDNDLIPVDNWAGFAERGGVQGAVQWMPLQDIVGALDKLRDYRKELIDLLHQVSGMNDIMRGASTQPNVTATEQGLKARFASVRVNALQDQFADFATGLQQLRAEVIVRHFDDQTIIERSGIMQSLDRPLVPQAMQLLRSRFLEYRVEIEPDNIARADYAALKSDRTEFLMAIGQFIGQALPLAQQTPQSAPALIEMVKWAAAGFRGGRQVETVLDQMLTQMSQQQQQGQGGGGPSDEQKKQQGKMQEIQAKGQQKMQEIQAKAQADMAKIQAEMQADQQKMQQEVQADAQRELNQARANIMEEQAKARVRAEEKARAGLMQPPGRPLQ